MKIPAFVLVLVFVLLPLQSSLAAQTWATCKPVRVATYVNRIHVRCAASIANIWYFAYPTSDKETSARMLSVASSSLIAGRTLKILYNPTDLSGGSFGCQTNDCRRMSAIEMY